MPAASYSNIRAKIAEALRQIDGLHAYDRAPGQVVTPAAVVLPGDPAVSYDSTMARGSDDMLFIVRVLVGAAVDQASQDTLDAYLAGTGDSSIKAVIDGNLDGTVHFARVAEARNYGEYEHGGVSLLGVEFVVEVTT